MSHLDAIIYTRFRNNIGDTATPPAFSDTDIDALYAEAGLVYTDTRLLQMYMVVLGINYLLANASKLTEYKQNNSSEKQQDIFKHLLQLRKIWLDDLETAAMRSQTGVGMPKLGIHRLQPKETPRKRGW